MTLVYVAGPMTTGDLATNITDAIVISDKLWHFGFTPFVPHLMHFYDIQCPHTYAEWIGYDLQWLRKCDIVFRLPGNSVGADIEVGEARNLGIPVYNDMALLVKEVSPL